MTWMKKSGMEVALALGNIMFFVKVWNKSNKFVDYWYTFIKMVNVFLDGKCTVQK